MKLIDIEPKVKALEEGLDGAMKQIGDLEKRLEQLAQKHKDLVHAHETHNHGDDAPTWIEEAVEITEEAAEEVVETVQEAAEEVANVVEETAEEVTDAFTAFSPKVEEESSDEDATFPEKTEEKVEVEPAKVANDRVDVNYVEIINKETGKTHRIHRNLLERIVGTE